LTFTRGITYHLGFCFGSRCLLAAICRRWPRRGAEYGVVPQLHTDRSRRDDTPPSQSSWSSARVSGLQFVGWWSETVWRQAISRCLSEGPPAWCCVSIPWRHVSSARLRSAVFNVQREAYPCQGLNRGYAPHLGLVRFLGIESKHGIDPSRDWVDPVPSPNPC
jgi:hypothetical protein